MQSPLILDPFLPSVKLLVPKFPSIVRKTLQCLQHLVAAGKFTVHNTEVVLQNNLFQILLLKWSHL